MNFSSNPLLKYNKKKTPVSFVIVKALAKIKEEEGRGKEKQKKELRKLGPLRDARDAKGNEHKEFLSNFVLFFPSLSFSSFFLFFVLEKALGTLRELRNNM